MRLIIYTFLFICYCFNATAQEKAPKCFIKAEVFFKHRDYYHAIKFYQLTLNKKSKKYTPFHNSAQAGLAASYTFINENELAEQHYKFYIKKNKKIDSNTFHLATVFKKNGKYKEAKEQYLKFQNNFPHTPFIQKHIASCDSVLSWNKLNPDFIVKNLSNINTQYSEITPVKYKEGIVFASNYEGVIIKKKDQTRSPYYDIYYASTDSSNHIKKRQIFSASINTIHHETAPCFSKNDKKIYFTRSNAKESNRVNIENKNKLKLFTAEESNGVWKHSELFIFNDSTCSFAQPSIDKDEKLFFFASDMPGGYGGTDIYVCLNINGMWTNPINLGSKINTAGNELYPFYHNSGTLYFASDFHEGYGGFDIFKALQEDGEWSQVINLKKPINSPADDFSIYWIADHSRGYFSSNRKGGKGAEDIYEIIDKKILLSK